MTREREHPPFPQGLVTQEDSPPALTHSLFTYGDDNVPLATELGQAWRDGYTAGHMDTAEHLDHDEETRNPYRCTG